MEYIVHRRFRGKALCGEVNLPVCTALEAVGGILYCADRPVCLETSENAHQYFARNDDGQGLRRGRLTQAILRKLARRDALWQVRWDIVWKDAVCHRFRRLECGDFWSWNHAFFQAEIYELLYVAGRIGIKNSF